MFFVSSISGAQMPREKPFEELLNKNLAFAAEQYILMTNEISDKPGQFPRTLNENGNLVTCYSGYWTSGFFSGSLWYLYSETGEQKFKELAEKFTFYQEYLQYSITNHDIGWIINCSAQNGYRTTQNEYYKKIVVQSAKSLVTRFSPIVACIRCWDEKEWTIKLGLTFPVNIDNMMNLELLTSAYEYTGDSLFLDIAVKHADKTIENQFRDDYSSYHVINYDSTGKVKNKKTVQGYSDNSSWARGQAWGLYGFTMMYRETALPRYLKQAINIANFITSHQNLPEDKIPYWDFDSPEIPNTLRDASAAAIMCSALIELSQYVDKDQSEEYLSIARQQLVSLSSDQYRSKLGKNGFFLLKHSVGGLPTNFEVDVPQNYADYYFIEALIRYKKYLIENQ